MYSREERYRSMSQATPWTVGPSASRDLEPPVVAADPMLQIAASAHAKIAGNNGLGNPQKRTAQRARFTGSASAPALHREFTLSASANQAIQNQLGQNPLTTTPEAEAGAVRAAARSQAKALVASRPRAAATLSDASIDAIKALVRRAIDSVLAEAARASHACGPPASSGGGAGGSSSAPMLPTEGAAMDAEVFTAPRSAGIPLEAPDGGAGDAGIGSGGSNPFARLKAAGPPAEPSPPAHPTAAPQQQQQPCAWTTGSGRPSPTPFVKGRVPTPTPLQPPPRPPGRSLTSPPRTPPSLRPLPPAQPLPPATVPLADDEVLVGSVANVAQRPLMATVGLRDGPARPAAVRAAGAGLGGSASAPPAAFVHDTPSAPSTTPRGGCLLVDSTEAAAAVGPPPPPPPPQLSASQPMPLASCLAVDGGTRGGSDFRASAFGRTLEAAPVAVAGVGTGLHASLSAVSGTVKQRQPRSEQQAVPPPPPTQPPPMAAITHSAQLVGVTHASCAEPRGSQLLPLRVCGALTAAPAWQEGWEWFGWDVRPFDARAAEVAAAVDVGAEWPEEADELPHPISAPVEGAVPPPPTAKLSAAPTATGSAAEELGDAAAAAVEQRAAGEHPSLVADSPLMDAACAQAASEDGLAAAGEGGGAAAGEGGGAADAEGGADAAAADAALRTQLAQARSAAREAIDPAAALASHDAPAEHASAEPDVTSPRPLAEMGGRELLKAIYARAVRLSEKPAPSASRLAAAPAAPLLRHALGKPAGCLCLELCEPGAYDALRAASHRLSRLESQPGGEPQPGGLAETLRELLPMLGELRHRVAVGRWALRRLGAALPPAPAGAAPTAALAVGSSLLSMAGSGTHPGAEAARQAAPEVAAALELWNRSGLAEVAPTLAADLSLHAHTLARHLSKSMPRTDEGELLQGVAQMPPHLAVIELGTAAHLECFRRIASWGDVTPEPTGPGTNQVPAGVGIGLRSGAFHNPPAACASTGAAAAPSAQWVQLLAQQLLCTLWRLHRCGALAVPIDVEVQQAAEQLIEQQRRARQAQLEQQRRQQPPPPPPAADDEPDEQDLPHYPRHLQAVCVQQALRQQRQHQVQKQKQQQQQAALRHSLSGPALHTKRTTGALAPTFTMATSKPAKRPAPQGALHRLGQERPAGPKLPFLTALIVPPKATLKEGEVPRMQLYHSENAPGYVHFSS